MPIRLVNQIIEQAIAQRVSDVHLKPHEKRTMVRFRIDGVMYDWINMRPEHHPTVISRIKVLSHMNIAERRLPLDGRFTVKTPQRQYDVRVSTVPGVYGEKAVLRLLPKGARGLELEELGLTSSVIAMVAQRLVRRVCEQCRTTEPASPELAEKLAIEPGHPIARGAGCPDRRHTGYHGGLAAFEVLRMSEAVKQAIHSRQAASTIRRLAIEEGMVSLRQDAVRKVLVGQTTPEEILRSVYLEE